MPLKVDNSYPGSKVIPRSNKQGLWHKPLPVLHADETIGPKEGAHIALDKRNINIHLVCKPDNAGETSLESRMLLKGTPEKLWEYYAPFSSDAKEDIADPYKGLTKIKEPSTKTHKNSEGIKPIFVILQNKKRQMTLGTPGTITFFFGVMVPHCAPRFINNNKFAVQHHDDKNSWYEVSSRAYRLLRRRGHATRTIKMQHAQKIY